MPTNAFAYLRVSTKGQVDGDGFPRQREKIAEYAASKEIEVVRYFEEKATCGATEMEDREAMQEMLDAMQAEGITVVIIERVDRLARDLMVQETIIADFQKRGYEIVSTLEPDLCSNEPTRVFIRQILGAVAQYDRAMIVAKLRVARQHAKARTGRCEGVKPYGVLAGEAETLARMQSLDSNGVSYRDIAKLLDELGIRSRSGNLWNPLIVGRILRVNDKAV